MSSKKAKSKLDKDKNLEKESLKENDSFREEHKDNKKNEKSFAKRGLFFLLKLFFIKLPIFVLFLVLFSLVVAKLYLSPGNVQNLIIEKFNKISNGKLELTVKSFDLYHGFVIDDLTIYNGDEFDNSKFVTIKKLVLDFSLFKILAGDVYFKEIGIYDPEIFIKQNESGWNFEKLMEFASSSSSPLPVEEESPIEETASADESEEIRLPIYASVLFNFMLNNLKVHVDSRDFSSDIEGLTFTTAIDIPPFKVIPKSTKAIDIIKKLKLELNPSGIMDVRFSSKEAEVKPPIVLNWRLNFDDAKKEFNSALNAGTYKTPVRLKKKYLAPLDFMFSYDVFINPIEDRLKIQNLIVRFKNKKWIDLSGEIKDLSKNEERYFKISMNSSNIDLDDLYPYYKTLTGDNKNFFSGNISLYPLNIKGKMNNLFFDSKIGMENLNVKAPGLAARVPRLDLNLSAAGSLANLKTKTYLSIPTFYYVLDRSPSGVNGLNLNLEADLKDNFKKVIINDVTFNFENPISKGKALHLNLDGDINLLKEISGVVSINKIVFNKKHLMPMLTKKLQKYLNAIPFKKPVTVGIKSTFMLGKNIKSKTAITLSMPDYNISKMYIDSDFFLDNINKKVLIDKFSVKSSDYGLKLNSSGFLDISRPPFKNSDINLSVELASPKRRKVIETLELQGMLKLNAHLTGDLESGNVNGNLFIKDLSVYDDPAMLELRKLNMNFPFEHSFKIKKGVSKISIDKSKFIDNRRFFEGKNFSINSVWSRHPARNIKYQYLKDMEGTIYFKDNVFNMEKLKFSVLDGNVNISRILFNLADQKPENMEFIVDLDVTNVDLARLDEFDNDKSKKKNNAEISLNMKLDGKGVDFKNNLLWNGSVNIYEIGDDMARKLLQGLSKEKGKSKLGTIGQFAVDNSTRIKSFNFNIDRGLAYVKVKLEKAGIFGLAVFIKGDEIYFERQPVKQIIRNVTGG